MLRKIKILFSGLSVIIMLLLNGFIPEKRIEAPSVGGAWKTQQSTLEQVLLFSDGYFMHTIFDGKLVDGNWHHSGRSSTGNPIYEVWSREVNQ